MRALPVVAAWLAVLAPPLPGQEPAAPTTAAAPPQFVELTVLGPAAWRSRLGPTNVGTMLASAGAARLWGGWVDALDAQLRLVRGDDAGFAAERARFLGFAGAVHVLAWLERAEDALGAARWSAALVIEDGGAAPGWRDEVERWLEHTWAPVRHWPTLADLQRTPLQRHGDRWIAVLAAPADVDGATRRAAAARFEPLVPSQVLRARVELQPALGLMRDRATERETMAALLGAGTGRLELALGHDGPHVALDIGFGFGDGGRALPGALFAQPPVDPRLAQALERLVPDGASAHRVGAVDLGAVWAACWRAFACYTEQPIDALDRRLDLDPIAAVFAHAEPAVLTFWHGDRDEAAGASLLEDLCIVVPLRDTAAFAHGLDALLQRFGIRADDSVDGELRFDDWHDDGLCIEVAAGLACVAFGAERQRRIDAVYERLHGGVTGGGDERAASRGRFELPTLLARHLANVATLALATAGLQLPLPDRTSVAAEVDRWLPLLQRTGLAAVRSVEVLAGDRWTCRFGW